MSTTPSVRKIPLNQLVLSPTNVRKVPPSAAEDAELKASIRARGLKQLALAKELGLAPGEFDFRRNEGGIAVSGEATIHGDHLYVQVSQPATGSDTGILFRSCKGRRDYTGGWNNFASLDLLHRPDELAAPIRRHSLPQPDPGPRPDAPHFSATEQRSSL